MFMFQKNNVKPNEMTYKSQQIIYGSLTDRFNSGKHKKILKFIRPNKIKKHVNL